ncbi:hypothetical protein IAT40_004579 [Kwoniella sp. CBS 6097]
MPLKKAVPVKGVPAIIAAAQKIRDTLDKDKSTGWREKVQKWADGKKKLEELLNDDKLPQEKVEVWTAWATNEIEPLFSKTTAPSFITFFHLLLEHLSADIIHPQALKFCSTGTTVAEASGPSGGSQQRLQSGVDLCGAVMQSPKVWLVVAERTILQSLLEDDSSIAHKKILYTESWLGIIVSLLEDCLQLNVGAWGTQAMICDALFEILAGGSDVQRKLLGQDNVLGFKRLGSMFRKTCSTSTLVPLLNIALVILPNHQAKKEVRETSLKQLVMHVGWDPKVTKQAFGALAKISLPAQEDEIMACVNAFAGDAQRTLPRGYQIMALNIDGSDRLASEKGKKYAQKGRVILYIDEKELAFKLVDDEGEETETFEVSKVVSFENTGSGKDGVVMTYRRSEPASGTMDIAFTVKPGEGEGLLLRMGKLMNQVNGDTHIGGEAASRPEEDHYPPYSLEEVVEEVNSLARREEEEAAKDLSEKQPPDSDSANHGEGPLSKGLGTRGAASHPQLPTSSATAASNNVTRRSKRRTASQASARVSQDASRPEQVEDVDFQKESDEDGDEEVEMPPPSQQLPVQEETATSRSKKKFGKPKGRASQSPTKTLGSELEDQSEDENHLSPPPTSARPSRASTARAVKATPISKRASTGVVKPPAPKSKPPTLGAEIKAGSFKAPAKPKPKEKEKEKPTQASVNAPKRGGSVIPDAEGESDQAVQSTPQSKKRSRQSLVETQVINEDPPAEPQSPLPWSKEAEKGTATVLANQAKKAATAALTKKAVIDLSPGGSAVPAVKKASAGVERRTKQIETLPASLNTESDSFNALSKTKIKVFKGNPNAPLPEPDPAYVERPDEVELAAPLGLLDSSPAVPLRPATPPQTAFKVPRGKKQVSIGNDTPTSPSIEISGIRSQDHQNDGPSASQQHTTAEAPSTTAPGKGQTKASNSHLPVKNVHSDPPSESPSSSPPPVPPNQATLLPLALGDLTSLDLPSSSQPEIQPIDLDDASSLSEAGHEFLRQIVTENQTKTHQAPLGEGNSHTSQERIAVDQRPIRALEPQAKASEHLSSKEMSEKPSSKHRATMRAIEEEEPDTEQSKKTLRSSMKGGHPSGEQSDETRPPKRARVSLPPAADEEQNDKDGRPAKKVKQSRRSSNVVAESADEGRNKSKSSNSGRKRSKSIEAEQEEVIQEQAKNQKKARKSTSVEREKERILTEEEKAKKLVSMTLDEIAVFLKDRCGRRIELSSKQSRMTRAQFGQIATQVVQRMHKQSVSLLNGVNTRHAATTKGYGELEKKDVDPMKKDFGKYRGVFEAPADTRKMSATVPGRAWFE